MKLFLYHRQIKAGWDRSSKDIFRSGRTAEELENYDLALLSCCFYDGKEIFKYLFLIRPSLELHSRTAHQHSASAGSVLSDQALITALFHCIAT